MKRYVIRLLRVGIILPLIRVFSMDKRNDWLSIECRVLNDKLRRKENVCTQSSTSNNKEIRYYVKR